MCAKDKKDQKQLNSLIRDDLEDYHFRLLQGTFHHSHYCTNREKTTIESNRISRVNVSKIKEKIEQEKSEGKTVQYRYVLGLES